MTENMEEIRNAAELKASARSYLQGRYVQAIPVHLLFLILSGALTSVNLRLSGGRGALFLLAQAGILLVGSVLASLLHFGLSRFYMNFCCAFPYDAGDLFKGFSFRDDRPVKIALLLNLVMVGCELPAMILYAVYLSTGIIWFMPLASLALCVGLTVYTVYYLGMSQCFYLLLDFPDKKLDEIISMSRWLMKGRRFRLFYLYVSYIPLYLLALLSCGIGLIWVLPYAETSYVCFHLNLTSVAASGR